MQKITYTAILLLGILLTPQATFAYEAISTKAFLLNEEVGVYFITYRFGHEDFEYRLPIMAGRGETAATDVEYSFRRDGTLRTSIGETKAIVLSQAKVENGMYVVPKNESRDFTLVTFLQLPKDDSSLPSNFNLKVDILPFTLIRDGQEYTNQLNDSELNTYQTPEAQTIYGQK